MLLQVFDRLALRLCKGRAAGTGTMRITLPDAGDLYVIPTSTGCVLYSYPLEGRQVTSPFPCVWCR